MTSRASRLMRKGLRAWFSASDSQAQQLGCFVLDEAGRLVCCPRAGVQTGFLQPFLADARAQHGGWGFCARRAELMTAASTSLQVVWFPKAELDVFSGDKQRQGHVGKAEGPL